MLRFRGLIVLLALAGLAAGSAAAPDALANSVKLIRPAEHSVATNSYAVPLTWSADYSDCDQKALAGGILARVWARIGKSPRYLVVAQASHGPAAPSSTRHGFTGTFAIPPPTAPVVVRLYVRLSCSVAPVRSQTRTILVLPRGYTGPLPAGWRR